MVSIFLSIYWTFSFGIMTIQEVFLSLGIEQTVREKIPYAVYMSMCCICATITTHFIIKKIKETKGIRMKALYANNILTIGKYGEAIIHASEIEDTALEQIQKLVDQPMAEGAHIRIMPDVHAGAGCVIGYTAKVTDKVVPNLIGVDIGCAVIAVELLIDKVPDLEELDTWVRKHIPTGRNIHSYPRLDEKNLYGKNKCEISVQGLDRIITMWQAPWERWVEGTISLKWLLTKRGVSGYWYIAVQETLASR